MAEKPIKKSDDILEPGKKKVCLHCGDEIPVNATRCQTCRDYIKWGWVKSHVTLIGVFSSVITIIISCLAIYLAWGQRQDKKEALQEVAQARKEIQGLRLEWEMSKSKQDYAKKTSKDLAEDNLIKENALKKAPEEVRKAIIRAFELKAQDVKFNLGGKFPDEGFDTSGFISYLLASADYFGFEDVKVYWSGKLKETLNTIQGDELKIGDLIFYEGLILMYLDDNKGIGMSSKKNIIVMDMGERQSVIAYRRWVGMKQIN